MTMAISSRMRYLLIASGCFAAAVSAVIEYGTNNAMSFGGDGNCFVGEHNYDKNNGIFFKKGRPIEEDYSETAVNVPMEDIKVGTVIVDGANVIRVTVREDFHTQPAFPDDQDVLVFIHGFNVSFKSAALTAARLSTGIGDIRTAFFSWPSRESVVKQSYQSDEACADVCDDALMDYIVKFLERQGSGKVHVIAHSMGCRPLLRALQRIKASHTNSVLPRSNLKFGQIVFAAPDVDAQQFLKIANQIFADNELADGITLYSHSKDKALMGSKFAHKYPRAGLRYPYTISPHFKTIVVDKLGYIPFLRAAWRSYHAGIIDQGLGHSYYEEPQVLRDLRSIMVDNRDEFRRENLIEIENLGEGNRAYLLKRDRNDG
mmetsp:Transcript_21112/g.21515  ORF Transcript_21112/g.21515 Transcript_21112/m.21515 type:complete len:374 (+) Transcript_21112:84-1205(+)